MLLQRVHPDAVVPVQRAIDPATGSQQDFDVECLLLILACIRPIASRRTPQQTVPSLHDVVAESTLFLSHELQSNGVTISFDLALALPPVTAIASSSNRWC